MRKVLIADDDPVIRQTVSDILATDERYEVLLASDGDEAQRESLLGMTDLIFLDLNLPKIDGWSVCRFLKMSQATNQIKIVILTGLTQDSVRQKSLQFGPDGFVEKPFRAREILGILDELLDGQQNQISR